MKKYFLLELAFALITPAINAMCMCQGNAWQKRKVEAVMRNIEQEDKKSPINHFFLETVTDPKGPFDLRLNVSLEKTDMRDSVLLELLTETAYEFTQVGKIPVFSKMVSRAPAAIRILTQAGVPVTSKCFFNACKGGIKDVISALDEASDIDWKNIINEKGDTVFHHCAKYSQDHALVEWLVDQATKEQLLTKNNDGFTVLQVLEHQGYWKEKYAKAKCNQMINHHC